MKKVIILSLWLGMICIPATAVGSNLFKQANHFHKSDRLDYVDKGINNTLNLYKISNTNQKNRGTLLYRPLNMRFTKNGINRLSIKQKRLLKKVNFYKNRRTRKYKRLLKKLNFYKMRRRKKFKRNRYLLQWFQNSVKVTL